MSIIDKVLGAVTPPESEEIRAEATAKARSVAEPGDWLSAALDHHDQIRAGFDACRQAQDGLSRIEAMRRLSRVLVGHSLAEEVVLYPALAKAHEKSHATLAYTEQTTAKMQMAELERIPPEGEAWDDKLEHIHASSKSTSATRESGQPTTPRSPERPAPSTGRMTRRPRRSERTRRLARARRRDGYLRNLDESGRMRLRCRNEGVHDWLWSDTSPEGR